MSNDSTNLEQPSVQAQVNLTTAKLGDLVTLGIRVTHPAAITIDAPALTKNLGTFEVYASTRFPTAVNGNMAVDQFQAALQNFTTGQQFLPPLDVPYRDPMGKTGLVKTSTLTVTIQEVPPGPKDKGDIRGIKGVIGPVAWSPWWWVLLGVIVACAAVYAWMKRKKIIQGPPPPPPVPADIVAMEKLKQLSESDWLATGKIKEYYSAISEILREYLEKGFEVSALERTTSEIMRDLRKKTGITMVRQAELRDLLESSDLVKFAKFRPDAVEAETTHTVAVKFIEMTRAVLRKDDEEFVPARDEPAPKTK